MFQNRLDGKTRRMTGRAIFAVLMYFNFFLFILDLFSLLYKNRKMKAGRMNKDNMAVSAGCMRGTFCYLNRYLRRYTDVTHLMAARFVVLNEIIQKQNI